MLFTGGVTVNDMSGPVGIVSAIGDSYEQSVSYGYFYAFLQMLYISIQAFCEPWCHEPSATPGTRRWKTCIFAGRGDPWQKS